MTIDHLSTSLSPSMGGQPVATAERGEVVQPSLVVESASPQGTTRRSRRSLAGALIAVLVVSATLSTTTAGPARAAASLPPRESGLSALTTISAQAQDPNPGPGPYEPGFTDTPLAGNPISAVLDEVPVQSPEMDTVDSALRTAERRRDEAIAQRDSLRRRIEQLGRDRGDAVSALEQRQREEAQRGEERQAAAIALAQRIRETEVAFERLEVARDKLRDLVVAAYVNASTEITDKMALIDPTATDDDAFLRLGYSDTSTVGRVEDVRDRLADHAAAEDAQARAEAALARAEQAERDAVTAREQAEAAIVAIDEETIETQQDEVRATDTVTDRDAGVLLAAAEIAPARLRADVTLPGIDFPLVALDAWVKAAGGAPCRVEWWMLAGISKIEGRHGTHGGGRLGARGFPSVEIIGPQLNGAGAFAEIRDTDGGRWDHDTAFDRAVGPMQFIPSTWAMWGRDGDGDGVANPHTIYDAAAAAAAYLCYGRSDLNDEAQLRAGYFSYNHSQHYVNVVLVAAHGYRDALLLAPHVPDPAAGDPANQDPG